MKRAAFEPPSFSLGELGRVAEIFSFQSQIVNFAIPSPFATELTRREKGIKG
jgi:hypothetical protein